MDFFRQQNSFWPRLLLFLPGTVYFSEGGVVAASLFQHLFLPRARGAFFTPNHPHRIGPFPGHVPSSPLSPASPTIFQDQGYLKRWKDPECLAHQGQEGVKERNVPFDHDKWNFFQ